MRWNCSRRKVRRFRGGFSSMEGEVKKVSLLDCGKVPLPQEGGILKKCLPSRKTAPIAEYTYCIGKEGEIVNE